MECRCDELWELLDLLKRRKQDIKDLHHQVNLLKKLRDIQNKRIGWYKRALAKENPLQSELKKCTGELLEAEHQYQRRFQ